MYAVATFLVVAVITMVFTQLATGALIATGMPPGVASFQARSAFSGAGFTTTETENVVNHPIRRRIIAMTMFVGALGTPTLVVTVLIGFIAPGPGNTTERTLVTISGLVLILLALFNRPMTRVMERIGQRYTRRRLLPAIDARGHELLSIGDGHVVASLAVDDESPDGPRSIRGLGRALPGIVVLGVRRGDAVIAESPTDIDLHVGDELLVFGARQRLTELGVADFPA